MPHVRRASTPTGHRIGPRLRPTLVQAGSARYRRVGGAWDRGALDASFATEPGATGSGSTGSGSTGSGSTGSGSTGSGAAGSGSAESGAAVVDGSGRLDP